MENRGEGGRIKGGLGVVTWGRNPGLAVQLPLQASVLEIRLSRSLGYGVGGSYDLLQRGRRA